MLLVVERGRVMPALDGFALIHIGVLMEEEQKTEPLSSAVNSARILPEILQALLHLRASVDALAVLTIETLAQVTQSDPIEIAKRYEKMQADNVLRHAFSVHEDAGLPKQERGDPS